MMLRAFQGGLSMSRTAVVAAWVQILLVAAGASAQGPSVRVPDRLNARSDESLTMVVSARGVQIYECRAKKGEPAGFEWAFLAPEAELYDAQGSRIGRHYAGPSWEANDGSRVEGTVKERADGPSGASIPWLLLNTRSVGPAGAFSKVTAIQRVNTVGGVPPSTGCTESANGKRARVSYTADYYLYSGR
jgi:hypothetical protein